MSRFGERVLGDFHRRIELRRRMLRHLGIDLEHADPKTLEPAVRRTLLACAQCPHPDTCRGWLDQGHDGAPLFCAARESFAELKGATALGTALSDHVDGAAEPSAKTA